MKVMDNVVYASAGYTSYAVTADGTLYGWGENSQNQLGFSGGEPCQSTPVVIARDVYAVLGSNTRGTLALKKDGSLWVCGQNINGALGIPANEQQQTLVKLLDEVALPSGDGGNQKPEQPEGISSSDVAASHWAGTLIQRAVSHGWVNGVGSGRFNPGGTLTGYEFFTLLGRACYPEDTALISAGQTDQAWWYAPCAAARRHGVLDGVRADGDMAAAVRRDDMALAIANLMKDKGFTVTESEKAAARAEIGDWEQIGGAYRDAVSTVYALGIITGTAQGTFAPEASMTRAEAAVVLCRLADTLETQA